MKKGLSMRVLLLASILGLVFVLGMGLISQFTGKAVEVHTIGPNAEVQACIKECASVGCAAGDMDCMKQNSGTCIPKCDPDKPEETEETSCMESCVKVGCGEIDFACQTTNQERCEKECNMIKEPEAKSEEEQCIRDCVNRIEPGLICQPGEGGEKGGDVCQQCAKECEHLYAGPCLNEEKLEAKKRECETCEHCYGEPVMGDSGEGYDCIVNVECKDATAMFGDEPGTGEERGGITEMIGERVSSFVESIGDFFADIFSGSRETALE